MSERIVLGKLNSTIDDSEKNKFKNELASFFVLNNFDVSQTKFMAEGIRFYLSRKLENRDIKLINKNQKCKDFTINHEESFVYFSYYKKETKIERYYKLFTIFETFIFALIFSLCIYILLLIKPERYGIKE